jgi:hypothetical protein
MDGDDLVRSCIHISCGVTIMDENDHTVTKEPFVPVDSDPIYESSSVLFNGNCPSQG